jgi:hypothetical protein
MKIDLSMLNLLLIIALTSKPKVKSRLFCRVPYFYSPEEIERFSGQKLDLIICAILDIAID